MSDETCPRCGGALRNTMVHPTTVPFHVQCRVHDRCYVLCDHFTVDHPPREKAS